ncbi:MAG: cytochrome o ubiquinol oxidase subunit III [Rhizobiales bacterium]|nr:cytochrome o ubiquinol oxidase subunit III [Hyphomicrobiales bacterium]
MTAAASAPSAHPRPPALDVYDQRAFGFWLYLMSDAIIFALLFATYVVMVSNTDGGPTGKNLFSLPHAFGETLLLLFSSLTFGFATLAMKSGKKPSLLAWLLVTFVLGLGFVVMEAREFSRMVQLGAGPDRSGFLSAFFTLVGTHGLHVSFGLIGILLMASQVAVKGLTMPVISRLSRLGLFWHFLDIVWVGIFSIVYLPGIL